MTSFFDFSGALDKDEFELLLMAMGHQLSVREIDACFADMGLDPSSGTVSFSLFFEWWTDSHGMNAIRKKTTRK
jgi:Ca2+-binding EF-hand superfamily protein